MGASLPNGSPEVTKPTRIPEHRVGGIRKVGRALRTLNATGTSVTSPLRPLEIERSILPSCGSSKTRSEPLQRPRVSADEPETRPALSVAWMG
jgi:hypothetical protein